MKPTRRLFTLQRAWRVSVLFLLIGMFISGCESIYVHPGNISSMRGQVDVYKGLGDEFPTQWTNLSEAGNAFSLRLQQYNADVRKDVTIDDYCKGSVLDDPGKENGIENFEKTELLENLLAFQKASKGLEKQQEEDNKKGLNSLTLDCYILIALNLDSRGLYEVSIKKHTVREALEAIKDVRASIQSSQSIIDSSQKDILDILVDIQKARKVILENEEKIKAAKAAIAAKRKEIEEAEAAIVEKREEIKKQNALISRRLVDISHASGGVIDFEYYDRICSEIDLTKTQRDSAYKEICSQVGKNLFMSAKARIASHYWSILSGIHYPNERKARQQMANYADLTAQFSQDLGDRADIIVKQLDGLTEKNASLALKLRNISLNEFLNLHVWYHAPVHMPR